jgi:hypothetical protein
MEVSSSFWILDITDWCHQDEETHGMYNNLSNVVHEIFLIIPYGVGVQARFSLGQDDIGRRESTPTAETVLEKAHQSPFDRVQIGMLAASDLTFVTTNPENDSEMKPQVEERILHRMAKV